MVHSAKKRILLREASLTKQMIGKGVTALGKANFADGLGEYYVGFFALSTGIERLTKLILVANYIIAKNEQMPDPIIIRKFGHNLIKLTNEVESISHPKSNQWQYPRPTSTVCQAMLECLNDFSNASKGRYANYASLYNLDLEPSEPIKMWWEKVAEPILESHYYGTKKEGKDKEAARQIDDRASSQSMVVHTDETGKPINTLHSMVIRTQQFEIVQKYSRFYALTIVRWLSEIFIELTSSATVKHRIESLSFLYEPFNVYKSSDSELKNRKIWPPKY